MRKDPTAHSCVSLFAALWCCRPLGMINPEELNIEREEEKKKSERGKERVRGGHRGHYCIPWRVYSLPLHIKPCSPPFSNLSAN